MSLLMKAMGVVAKLVPDRDPDELATSPGYIGKSIDRLDGRAKVTGTATFAAEHQLPGLLHAALAYSTISKGTIVAIDTRLAEAVPGVLHVITHENAPRMKDPPPSNPTGTSTDNAGTAVNVLNTKAISWNGQPVAIVIADTLDRAEAAASLVQVSYAVESAETSFEQAKPKQKPPKEILGEETELRKGDAEAALRITAFKVDQNYFTPFLSHNAIEPHATIAHWSGNELTLYSATQYLQGEAATIAEIFSLKPNAVRVVSPFVGGAFGGKGSTWCHVQLTALAAKVAQQPVRLALSREGVFRIVGGRTRSDQRVALGATAEGKLTSLIHSGVTANSFDNDWPEQFSFPARHLYAVESYFITQAVARLNMTANTAMRAPGESIGTFALESAMDELAYALDMDPIELRLRNEPDRDPTNGARFSSRHLRNAYQMGAEKFGWQQRAPVPRSMRDGSWLIGHGMAAATYPAIRLSSAARVRINADGTALVQTSAHEMGMGTATAQTQAAADRFGLVMDKVRFEYGDSSLPHANFAGGSSQAVSIALAVQQAYEKVKGQLLALSRKGQASPLADAKPEDLHGRDGGLFRIDRPDLGETYSAILARAGALFVEAEVKTGPPLEMLKYSMHSYGAQFCELRVHESTGEVRIARWVAAFDTGRILNPKMARSQFRGGIIMGIGMALTEETLFDERTGRIMNPNLAEYHVPVHADIPQLDILYTDIADPHTPLGAHGVGEIGITGTAAAVANAIYHATGKRIRSLPITLDKLL